MGVSVNVTVAEAVIVGVLVFVGSTVEVAEIVSVGYWSSTAGDPCRGVLLHPASIKHMRIEQTWMKITRYLLFIGYPSSIDCVTGCPTPNCTKNHTLAD